MTAIPSLKELSSLLIDRLQKVAAWVLASIDGHRANRETMITAIAGGLAGEEGAGLDIALAECSSVD